MKTHTSEFKNKIKEFGKELDSIITYTINGTTTELGNEYLNSVTPHYEGSILKSVMKQLDIDSKIDIPIGTEINFQFGVKVRNEEVEDYRDNYDYINFGNYIVKESEKKEDKGSYLIKCYDKLLYSMKEYENMNITYPITIRNYINTICNHLGLTFANASSTFANYNKTIPAELYLTYNQEEQKWESLDYTFRDVLDELAQATASTICINENDELEIRYITETGDTIDKQYLKDININFGEHYGPINTIVLSRAGGADNIYLSYPEDLPDDEKIAVKIADNQIMSRNDRDSYMSDILTRLRNIQYYINDFSSPGICYYDICDRYTVQIDNIDYSCIMLNDEINITQGLSETIHTEIPKEAETDYSKADKTDRRINQTYIIVDKQNQEISSVVSQVGNQNNKISTLTQKVDSIESEIQNITGMTQTKESNLGIVTFDDITTQSEPITLKIHPIGESFSYLYPTYGLYPTTQHYPAKAGLKPSNNLTPSNSLTPSTGYPEQNIPYLKTRKIRFHNITENEDIDYELPDDLLYYDATHYDEFYLDLESDTCQIEKKCKFNSDGTIGLLSSTRVDTYTYPVINLTEGTYSIYPLGYGSGYIYATLMTKNIYTDQFYTKMETDSKISQTATDINLSVNQTLSNYSTTNQMNAAIDVKANQITSTVSETYATKTTTNQLSSRISQTAKGISLTVNNGSTSSGITIGITKEDGTTTQTSGTIQMTGLVKFTDLSGNGTTTINGSNIKTGTIDASQVTVKNLDASKINTGTLTAASINLGSGTFAVNTSGILTATAGTIGGWTINSNKLGGNNTYLNPNGACQFYPSGGAIVGWNDAIREKAPNGIALYNSYTNYSGGTSITKGIHLMADGGNLDLMQYSSSYGVNIRSNCSPSTQADASARSIMLAAGNNITLHAVYGAVYANSSRVVGVGYVLTDVGQASSKNTKTNIKSFTNNDYNDALNLLKNIDICSYDYKYKLYEKDHQYGFIIDDIEKQKGYEKFFDFRKDKAKVNKDNSLDFSLEGSNKDDEFIEVKKYDTNVLDKYMLTCIKALQNKIEKLEEKKNE